MPEKLIIFAGGKTLSDIILAVSAGIIGFILDPEKPTTKLQWVTKPFVHTLFALFTVIVFASPTVEWLDSVTNVELGENTAMAISATMALSAKDILLFVKEVAPTIVKKLTFKFFK